VDALFRFHEGSETMRRQTRALSGILALLLFAASAAAQSDIDDKTPIWLKGNALLELCSPRPRVECGAYIDGVQDAMNFFVVAQAVSKLVCIPVGTQKGQIIGAVVSFLRDNPSAVEYGAASDVLNALKEAFPCR
jgi:hypothetical protein